jgi:hypothetical protein
VHVSCSYGTQGSLVAALTFSVGGAASAVTSAMPGDPSGAGSSGPGLLPLSTESSNSYLLPDGSVRVRAFAEPVNFQDARGDWQPIDTTLADAPGEAYAAETTDTGYTAQIPADAGSTPVKVADEGFWVTLKMRGLDGAPTVEGGADTYRHGGRMSTIEHISYRHAYGSGSPSQQIWGGHIGAQHQGLRRLRAPKWKRHRPRHDRQRRPDYRH